MKIRYKLTLLFTLLFTLIICGFAFFIYYSSAENREDEYFKRLKQLAITKTNLLLDAKVAPDVLQLIYKNAPNNLFQEEVAVYDTAFHLLYHDAVNIDKIKETKSMIGEIVAKGEIQFNQGQLQAVGFLYPYKGRDYVITAAAKDEYGLAKLSKLRFILTVSVLGSLLLTIFAGYFFAKRALKPVAEMVDEIEELSAKNLDQRLKVTDSKDEIAELALTFNRMLDRLAHSFEAQKEFVAHISHELRTPLATVIAELEISQNKERTVLAYQNAIALALKDARKLARLSTSLLDLANANYDQAVISFKELRLDEVLLDARNEVLQHQPEYKVKLIFDQEAEDDDFISIRGNEYLLKIAFINLMENNCKFSEHKESTVSIAYDRDQTILRFVDQGIGISEADRAKLFEPFFRGGNQHYAEGNGIGLALTKKIVDLHHGTIVVISEPGEGSTFILTLRHI
ncbi:HAMP domain-containing sensor histidine kinase [Pedobacter gandavensis]|uniref:HAMP domain-containing sensor histidine kinase n=1 Tax=Pedobacter gandavensis TaxID=2679963 RepID=UPI00292CBFB2|nr:HAMP domain-containing sensor histidine kinase [Pedobacter gandavensis]